MTHSRLKLAGVLLAISIITSACGGGGGGGGGNSVSGGGGDGNTGSGDQVCDPASTGLVKPLPACTATTPCTRVASELSQSRITDPSPDPVCDSSVWTEKLTQNVSGFTRHSCVYRPPGVSASSTRPLVLWFHPGGDGTADTLSEQTHLLQKAEQFNLSGDPARPGFVLVAIQGRNLRFPTLAARDGHHHDFYFRDLASPSTNPDIANADSVIDTLVSDGIVDTNRIYVMGWSNGAFFAQMYAIARHETRTPGGNEVAAASVFGAGDPFNSIRWDPFNERGYSGNPSCQLTSYPVSSVPMDLVYRSCDAAVGCDAQQQSCFDNEPGYATQPWLNDSNALGLSVMGNRIGGLEAGAELDQPAAACTSTGTSCAPVQCSVSNPSEECLCLVNHLRWPDASYDSDPTTSSHDLEVDMLDFLRANPL